MKKFKERVSKLFSYVAFLFNPDWVQRLVRACHIQLPHRLAVQLDYRGLVDFAVNGKKLYLQSYNEPIEILIFWYGIFGKWEATQLRLWSLLVHEADTVLDIGANTGVYSVLATTNEKTDIYAFEPIPVVREMLERNNELNGAHIHIQSTLVGDDTGEATMYIPRDGWVDVASLDKEFATRGQRDGSEMQAVTYPMTTVDAFLGEQGVSGSVIAKIDVEGAEDKVLRGMQKTLEKRDIQFTLELLDADYFATCVALIPEAYHWYAINEVERTVYQVDTFVPGVSNYLFTKQSKDFSQLWQD